VWGALLSTITLLWNLYRDFASRPKLRLFAGFGTSAGPIAFGSNPNPYLTVTIANVGRRPITIIRCALTEKDKSGRLFGVEQLPRTIAESETFVVLAHAWDVTEKLDCIVVNDSSGREWKIPGKPLLEQRDRFAVSALEGLPPVVMPKMAQAPDQAKELASES
jgi:hypothetical protein